MPALEPVAPERMAQAVQFTTKPNLDGKFNESTWQTATPVKMTSSKDYQTDVRFGYDNRFLYLAVSATHPTGKHVPKVDKRERDADLSGHDRVEFAFDLDRDGESRSASPSIARLPRRIVLGRLRLESEMVRCLRFDGIGLECRDRHPARRNDRHARDRTTLGTRPHARDPRPVPPIVRPGWRADRTTLHQVIATQLQVSPDASMLGPRLFARADLRLRPCNGSIGVAASVGDRRMPLDGNIFKGQGNGPPANPTSTLTGEAPPRRSRSGMAVSRPASTANPAIPEVVNLARASTCGGRPTKTIHDRFAVFPVPTRRLDNAESDALQRPR